VPSAEDASSESFRGRVLQLRGRIGWTQRELAAGLHVHVHTIQAWEAGVSYPGVASLQALIAAVLRAGGFTPRHEADEATALWAAIMEETPRLRTPFDRVWFDTLVGSPPVADTDVAGSAEPPAEPPAAARAPAEGTRRQSWGEAPDVVGFLGRATERETLRRWVADERCRLVAIQGLGGIGKSLLGTRVAQDLAPSFELVYWRSLRDAPAPREWLAGAIGALAPGDADMTLSEAAQVRRLLELMSETRCLLVLDNFETVLRPGERIGGYTPGYESYGTLLRQLAEAPHQSCLLLTSREEPPELGPLRGDRGPVRTLDLTGFDVAEGRALLRDKRLDGSDDVWQDLVRRYGGNGLALRVVSETIRELFGGAIAEYLDYVAATPGVIVGGVRQLLETQIRRLSDLEQDLLRWLAVEREPIGFAEIAADLGGRVGQGAILEAVEALRRRSLLERAERRPMFNLHSVVLEYVTDQLIDDVAQEIVRAEPDCLLRQPLLKATARDFVRRNQERLIVAPLLERLVTSRGSARAVERLLLTLLDTLRARPQDEQGYGPGNLVNLLRMLRGDLRQVDLSGLMIRQAHFQVEAQDANLSGTHLSETVLAEAFNFPSAMALSADRTFVAAGTSTGDVCVWRVSDRTLLVTLRGHVSSIRGIALSRDNSRIATSGFDGTVRIWETIGGRHLMTMRGHEGPIYHVALSDDGALAASAGQDGTVRLWDTDSGRLVRTLEGSGGGNWGVALSGDGLLVASGSGDGVVRLWETTAGGLVGELRGHTSGALGVALSQDGRVVASGSYDGTVKLWDTQQARLLQTLDGHHGGVRGVALSADGHLVASGNFDGTVRLWEASSGRLLTTVQAHIGLIYHVALSADGTLLASGSFDGSIKLWETDLARSVATLYGYNSAIRGLAASGNGHLLVSGGYDGTVHLWEPQTGRLLATLTGHTSGIRNVAVTTDGRLVASGSFDGTIKLWDADGGRLLTTITGPTGGVWGVALSGDGRLVAGGGYDGTVGLWDAASGRLLTTIHGHPTGIRDVALSHDGGLLVSGSEDRSVRVWETASGRLLASCEGHDGGVWGVALSRDGQTLASGGDDRTVRLWETQTGRLLASMHGHDGGVWGVALAHDGQSVASAGIDGTVRLWETQTGRLLATLRGHKGGVWGVALMQAGSALAASGGVDGTVRIWDADSGELLRSLRGDRRYERLDITNLTGITEAQHDALLALGAVEHTNEAPRQD
jgi:WD40 repeat protein/transcriptional regulator with XRE-family HTH domain